MEVRRLEISDRIIKVCFINVNESIAVFEGLYHKNEINDIYICVNHRIYPNERKDKEKIHEQRPFKFSVSVQQTENIVFFCDKSGNQYPFSYGKFFPIQKRYKNSYYFAQGIGITREKDNFVIYTNHSRAYFERRLIIEMLFQKKRQGIKDAVIRCITKKIYGRGKKIWVISDRIDRGGDNGEALFRYVCENKIRKCYFAVSKDSEDYKRLKKIGKVINFGGRRYKLLYLLGAIMISSQAEDVIFRPLKGNTAAVSDIIQKRNFVFLQHGVTKDDLSDWLNRFNKNIAGFVCATKNEAQSILNYNYDYEKENVWLTGFPRHDLLKNAPQKIVTVMFTWRFYLVEMPDKKTGRRALKEGFIDSSYYKTLAALIKSDRIRQTLEKYGYKMQFVLHPCMEEAQTVFKELKSDYDFIVHADYQKIFEMSDLIVTDYSSVAFEFAILRKPVIYCQCDQKQFFSGAHMYHSGYFNYEKDGFGDVIYDVDQCIEKICSFIVNGCQMQDIYKERIEKTFPYGNCGNSSRVCGKIIDCFENIKKNESSF